MSAENQRGMEFLASRRNQILELAAKYGARNVRVFGSVARGEETHGSDIDLLVTLDADRSLLDHAALQVALQNLLGCPVDIATERGLRPQIRTRVLREAVPL